MNTRRTFFTAIMVALVVFQFAPSATTLAGAATVCNWAMFVADVTVPDGSLKAPGEAFTKTWRIKNIGSCTWNTSYSAVFSDGDSLGAPTSVPLPKSVAPGINVDISVSMTAPSASGHYRGNWKLKDAGGNAFGIGASASNPFWVDILVASGNGAVVDLAANACSAKWISGVGLLPCPGTDGASSGFVLPVSNPTLEDGSVDPLPGLLVFPQNKFDGYIQGFYPYYTVQNGDHFQAAVGCANGSACLVTYRLDYQAVEGGVLHILWQWKEANDGKIFNLDYDLSALAGKSVRFVLTVLASGPASGDRAVWAHPRIVGAGAPTATPPPTGSVTNVVVTAASVTDASCGGPNVTGFHGEITTNGAAEVTYHWEVGGDKTSISTDEHRSFPAAGTQTFDTDAYKADCGNYFARLVVTSPNAISAQASFIIAAQPPSPTEPTATEPPPTSTPQAGTALDFTADLCSAKWISGAGLLPCPMIDGDVRGFALRADNPVLENGSTEGLPAIIVSPQKKTDGYIQGFYPYYTVQPGDHFQAAVGCANGSPCNVIYRLDYQSVEGGVLHILWKWNETADNHIFNLDFDLSALAGKRVRFVLTLLANGPVTGDRAIWAHPRIVGTGAPTATPPAGWLTYSNPTYGFQFNYPPDAVVGPTDFNAVHMEFSIVPGTNLVSKYLDATATQGSETCSSSLGGTQSQVTINGLVFTKQLGEDGGAGQRHDWTVYSTKRGDVCVSLAFILHWSPSGNFDPPRPEFDRVAETAVFDQMISSFSWITSPSPSPTEPTATEPTATEPPPTSTPLPGTALDFSASLCSAKWQSGAGVLPCPMTDGDVRGYAIRADNPVLENGSTEGLPGIIVAPQKKTDGYIQGFYPYYTVQPGDHFQASVGCANGSPCNVIYRLDYQSVEGGVLHILWKWNEAADGKIFDLDFDLSALAGRNVRFVLTLLANGPVTGDRAIWAHPRIVHGPAPTVTPPSGWSTYTSPTFGFQFSYPSESQASNVTESSIHVELPFTQGTTLHAKWLDAGAVQTTGTCNAHQGGGTQSTVNINGFSFLKQVGSEGAAGRLFRFTSYSTARGDACVVFDFVMRSIDNGALTTPLPEYNVAAESAVFAQIMNTFSWPATPATNVQVFFYQNPDLTATAVQRAVYSSDLPQAALSKLFEGPTAGEQAAGLSFNASGATGFSSLSIADGVANVFLTGDCNSQGSTFTIAGLIRPTLLQFAQVQHVRIYDQNGNTENTDPGADSIPACLEP